MLFVLQRNWRYIWSIPQLIFKMADEATEAPEAPPREPVMSPLNVDPRYKGHNWLFNYRLFRDKPIRIEIETLSKFYFSSTWEGWMNTFFIWAAKEPWTFLYYVLLCLSPFFLISALLSWKLSKAIEKQEKKTARRRSPRKHPKSD